MSLTSANVRGRATRRQLPAYANPWLITLLLGLVALLVATLV